MNSTMTQSNGLGKVFLFFALICLFGVFILMLSQLENMEVVSASTLTDEQLLALYPEPISPITVQRTGRVSQHGITKHPEAAAIEEACNKSIFQVWRDKYERKYYYLCKTAEGKWGLIPVIISSAGERIWKTAFSPGTGVWADVVRYLTNTATRYKGPIK